MSFAVEFSREVDGRWIAEVKGLGVNGVLAYGKTKDEARQAVEDLARRVLAERTGRFSKSASEAKQGKPMTDEQLAELQELVRSGRLK